MTDHSDLVHHSLAMFASNSKPNSSSQNQSQSHGFARGRGRNNSNRGKGGGRYSNNGGQPFTPQASQNYSPQSYQNQNPSQNFKVEIPSCQICGKSGHQALGRYHRMDFAYQGKNQPTKPDVMASASNATITNNQAILIILQPILTTFHSKHSIKDLDKSLWEVTRLYQSITQVMLLNIPNITASC